MEPFASLQEMLDELKGIVEISSSGKFTVVDEHQLRGRIMDMLVWTSVFTEDAGVRDAARWIIRMSAVALMCPPTSIQALYEVVGRNELTGFTAPAINVRGATFEIARSIFRAADETEAAIFIFEIARSEIGYTDQRPAEFASAILGAAIREGWKGPVFLQGDHFQFNAEKYAKDGDAETQAIKDLTKEAIEAGFFNIDIDSSTLVNLSHESISDQQRENFTRCAELTAFIRQNQPQGVTVSVGGEIGEVGKENSTVEEFEAFMEGYRTELDKLMPKVKGISKISIQTGTEHGGRPLADGTMAEVNIDFDAHECITRQAREKYQMAGTVQHGASTLPQELLDEFPRSNCIEIHLATHFQNMFFEHPSFPRELRDEMDAWIRETLSGDFKEDYSEAQNLYKTRKKAWGPFKKKIWGIDEGQLNPILLSLERQFATFFQRLNVVTTKPMVSEFIRMTPFRPPIPESLKSSLATA